MGTRERQEGGDGAWRYDAGTCVGTDREGTGEEGLQGYNSRSVTIVRYSC